MTSFLSRKNKTKKGVSPFVLIVFSFLLLIILGALLFLLPFATKTRDGVPFLDAFFLATSAVTISGLVPTTDIVSTLSTFGVIVLMLLVQIGGLGVVTIGVFVLSLLGGKLGVSDKVLLKENFNSSSLKGITTLLKKIVTTTLIIEFIGFMANLFVFVPVLPAGEAIVASLFHAINAFNNAGFTNLFDVTRINYDSSVLLTINTLILVILGGLGFIVIFDLTSTRRWKEIKRHTKIVLGMSLFLWLSGTLLLFLGQVKSDFLPLQDALFLSITARTAGIHTTDLNTLSSFSLLVLISLMFVGGSPTSTAGGLKTTTLFTLVKTITSEAKGIEVTTQKRQISHTSINKAFVLFILLISLIFSGTLLVLLFDDLSLGNALFNVVSATSNTGFSLTPLENLSHGTHAVLIILMFIGRVGPLTLLALFNRRKLKIGNPPISYLEETIIIG